MAKAMYAVVGGATKKIKSAYCVVGGVTKKLKAVYAVVDGKTKVVWTGGGVQPKWQGVVYKSNTSDDYYGKLQLRPRTKGTFNLVWPTPTVSSDTAPYCSSICVSEDGVWCGSMSSSSITFYKYDGTTFQQTAMVQIPSPANSGTRKAFLNSDGSVLAVVHSTPSTSNSSSVFMSFFTNNNGTSLTLIKTITLLKTAIHSSYPSYCNMVYFDMDLKWQYIALGTYFYNSDYPYGYRGRAILKLNSDFSATTIATSGTPYDEDYYVDDGSIEAYMDPNGRYAIIGEKDTQSTDTDYQWLDYYRQGMYYLSNGTATKMSTSLDNGTRLMWWGIPFSSNDGKTLYIQREAGSGAYSQSLLCYSCSGSSITSLGSYTLGNYVSCLKELFTDDIHGLIHYAEEQNNSDFGRYFATFSKNANGLITACARSTYVGGPDTSYALVGREF